MEPRDWQHGMTEVVAAFDAANPYGVGYVSLEGPGDPILAAIARSPEQRARAMVGSVDTGLGDRVVLVESAGARIEGEGPVEILAEFTADEYATAGGSLVELDRLVLDRFAHA